MNEAIVPGARVLPPPTYASLILAIGNSQSGIRCHRLYPGGDDRCNCAWRDIAAIRRIGQIGVGVQARLEPALPLSSQIAIMGVHLKCASGAPMTLNLSGTTTQARINNPRVLAI